ncbi:MAG: hypothetical protein LQ348_004161 [Seirophora lacunosa]|nr:MAG: hypothetical protein LQ348_004161 [Seirophora lacunosa]
MSALPYRQLLTESPQLRLLYVLPAFNATKPRRRQKGQPTRLLVVLGSGGHTAEMLSILQGLDPTLYTHRSYVVSSGDDFSALKAIEFESTMRSAYEQGKRESTKVPSTYDISVVPRARNIHQPLLTTPISSLRCLLACFSILRATGTQSPSGSNADQRSGCSRAHDIQYAYPDLIVANGPATAVLIVIASLLLRIFRVPGAEGKMRTIYVESWARVSTLSLSGKILRACGMVNRMLVQWETLGKTGQGEFRGALVQ